MRIEATRAGFEASFEEADFYNKQTQDENNVILGDNVFLAPHVSIYTAGHPIDAETRNTEVEYGEQTREYIK